MHLYLDTANIEHIRHGVKLGVITGVTTNPSLVSKEGKVNYKSLVQEICSIVPGPVSTEVLSQDASGMVTEADFKNWNEQQLRPYLEIVLDSFGPSRLMFGSDWPVCLLATGYEQWVEIIRRFIASLSPDEQKQIWESNAHNIYNS